MAISYGSNGTNSGTTADTINPGFPSGKAAGNLLVVSATYKYPATVTPSTPSGWTQHGPASAGSGTGVGAGAVGEVVFTKVAEDALTTTSSLDYEDFIFNNDNMVMYGMTRFANATGLWNVASSTGADTTSGTAISITFAGDPGFVAGDWAVVAAGNNTNAATTHSSTSISATGISVWGTATQIVDGQSSQGDDASRLVMYRAVTTGTSSAAPVFVSTADVSVTATAAVVLRLREVSTVKVDVIKPKIADSMSISATAQTIENFDAPPGGSSGEDLGTADGILDGGSTTAPATFKYSNTRSITGGYSVVADTPDGTGNVYRILNAHASDQNLAFMRCYIYWTGTNPTSTTPIFTFSSSAGVNRAQIVINTSGQIRMRNNTTLVGTAQTLNKNQWYRLEWKLDTTNSQQTMRLFTAGNLHGSTADVEDLNQTFNSGSGNNFRFGITSAPGAAAAVTFDSLATSTSAYVGAAPARPLASFTKSAASGTAPLDVTFTDTSSFTPTSWLWDFGDGYTSTLQNPVHSFFNASTYTVKLTATNANGSDTSVAQDIVISAGTPTTYYATGFESGTDGTEPTTGQTGATDLNGVGTGLLYSASTKLFGNFSLASDGQTGTRTLRKTTTTKDNYLLGYLYIPTPTATNDPITAMRFRTSGSLHVSNFIINPDGTISITNGNTTVVWTSTNAYYDQWIRCEWYVQARTYGVQSLIISYGDGLYQPVAGESGDPDTQESSGVVACNSQNAVDMFIHGSAGASVGLYYLDELKLGSTYWHAPTLNPPVADFTRSVISGSVPLTVALTDISTGNPTSWNWDFGDGGTTADATTQDTTVTYNSNGVYSVTLTATNAAGSSNKTKKITVAATSPFWETNFDSGTNGVVVDYEKEGFTTLTGDTNFFKYTSAASVSGSLSGQFLPGAQIFAEKIYAPARKLLYLRGYFKFSALPTSSLIPTDILTINQGGSPVASLGLNTFGAVIMTSTTGQIASTANVTTGTWHRIEWKIDFDNSVQEARIFIGANKEGAIDAYNFNILGGLDPLNQVDSLSLGMVYSDLFDSNYLIDNMASYDTTWVGPISAPAAGAPIAYWETSTNVDSGLEGTAFTFNDLSTGIPTSWAWNYGDGGGTTDSTAQNPTKTYATYGSYLVTLTATNAFGSSQYSRYITVRDPTAPPVALKVRNPANNAWLTDKKAKVRVKGQGWVEGTVRAYINVAGNMKWSGDPVIIDTDPQTPTVAPGLAQQAAGNIPNGDYQYTYTAYKGTTSAETAQGPTGSVTVNQGDTLGGVQLTLTAVTYADGYNIYVLPPGGVWTFVASTTNLTYTDLGVWSDGPVVTSDLPGDPGAGKLYWGWGWAATQAEYTAEIALMKTISYPASGGDLASSGNTQRKPSMTRSFGTGPYDSNFGPGDRGRDGCAAGRVVLSSQGAVRGTVCTDLIAVLKGTKLSGTAYDFIQSTISDLKYCKNNYNGIIWWAWCNEPDEDGWSAAEKANLRTLTRLWRKRLIAEGLDTNVGIATPTSIQSVTYHTANTSYTNNGNGWWQWNADWKGTLTNWATKTINGETIRVPNKADFYGPIAQGYAGPGPEGLERVVQVIAHNMYCWHAQGGALKYNPTCNTADHDGITNINAGIWCDWASSKDGVYNTDGTKVGGGTSKDPSNIYEAHRIDGPMNPIAGSASQQDSHGGQALQIRDELYGKNFPIIIGELGFPPMEDVNQSYPSITMQQFMTHYQTMVNRRIIGVCLWRQEGDAHTRAYRTPFVAGDAGGGNSIGGRLTDNRVTHWQGQLDPNDARGKAMAKIMDQPGIKQPRAVGPP